MNATSYQFGANHAGAGRQPNGPGEGPPSETWRPLDAPLMEQIAGDPILEEAYGWLCHQRQDASPHDDVWMLDHQILSQQLQQYVADERTLVLILELSTAPGLRRRRI